MRREFYRVYEQVDREYAIGDRRRFPRGGSGVSPTPRDLSLDYDSALAIVNTALSEALESFPGAVRPDAVHFLRINLHQMITAPLLHPLARRAAAQPVHPAELREDLRHDAELLLHEATREGTEVTGHALVDALSRVWEFLRVNAFDIWG